MKLMRIALSLAIVLGRPPSPAAEGVETAEIPVGSLVEEALKANPGLKAARERLAAALKRPAKVRALPDPKLAVTYLPGKIETRAGPQESKVGISQGLPFHGKRALRAESASRRAEVARQAVRAGELRVRADVVRAYYDLYYLRRAAEILGEQVQFLRHFSRVAEKKYAVGKGPQATVFRAQAELFRLQNEVTTVEQEAPSRLM